MPRRNIMSKHFIPKVTFLCTIARSQQNEKMSDFYGKTALWPFLYMVTAQRSIFGRSTGTRELKPLTINWEKYFLVFPVKKYPDFCSMLPVTSNSNVVIQQDDAQTDVKVSSREVSAEGLDRICNMNLKRQLANSLDFNVSDLEWSSCIQTVSQEKEKFTIPCRRGITVF